MGVRSRASGTPVASSHLARRVDGVDVVVLVTALVLDIEHVAAVLGPEVTADRTFGVGRDGPGGVVRCVDCLHPDVHHVVVGLAEGDPLAVRRNLGAGDLGIAEEDVPVDQRRQLRQTTLDGIVLGALPLARLPPTGRRRGLQTGHSGRIGRTAFVWAPPTCGGGKRITWRPLAMERIFGAVAGSREPS